MTKKLAPCSCVDFDANSHSLVSLRTVLSRIEPKKGELNTPLFLLMSKRLFARCSEVRQEGQQVRCTHRVVAVQIPWARTTSSEFTITIIRRCCSIIVRGILIGAAHGRWRHTVTCIRSTKGVVLCVCWIGTTWALIAAVETSA